MTIREDDVAAMRGPALLPGDGEPGLDHVTMKGRAVLLASLLVGHGMARGDVVAVLSEHSPRVYELVMGARHAGLVLLVVDPAHTLEQNAFAINTSGALVLVASSRQASRAQALQPLTPYIRARYGLDGELAEHRSLALARSSAPIRVTDAPPSGTLHHAIGPSGRPVEIRLADPLADAAGREHCSDLIGDIGLGPDTVCVGATPVLSPVSAVLGAAVIGSGGSVAVPRNPTGVEALRCAFGVDATLLHLSSAAACEVREVDAERVRRLTPPGLRRVVVDGAGCTPGVRHELVARWGELVRFVEPSYGEAGSPDPECSVTHAEI